MNDPQIDYLQGEITRLEGSISDKERTMNVLKHGSLSIAEAFKKSAFNTKDFEATAEAIRKAFVNLK